MQEPLIVLDVGANKGEFLDHILKSYVGAKVIAFEPNQPLCMDSLEKLKIKHKDRLEIEYKALGSKSGKSTLYGANLMNGQLGSLLPLNSESVGWKEHTHLDLKNYENLTIDTISVIDYLKNSKNYTIDLLKIDTQGTDLSILAEFLLLSEVKVGIIEIDAGNFGLGSRYKTAVNDINKLANILSNHNFLITKLIPNNAQSDEFNVYFAKSFEDFELIYGTLNLANNPVLSRYSIIQDLYSNSNLSILKLSKKLIKKIYVGLFHPRSSLKSLIIKVTS